MDDAAPTVDLAHLDDATFQRLYKERIEPCFAANEADRLAAVARFKSTTAIGAVVVLAIGAAVWMWSGEPFIAFMATLTLGLIGIVFAYHPIRSVAKKLKQDYCAAIAAAMGASFQIGGFDPPALERMKALKLLPSYSKSGFEDLFNGAHKGARFELYEGHLQQRTADSKGRTRYTTVFRGQLIRMRFPRDFLGVTIVRRDMGVFNVFGGGESHERKLERVRLVDPTFEKAFEVWGTDQVEARYLLHPVMMERLIALESGLHGRRIRCAFEGGDPPGRGRGRRFVRARRHVQAAGRPLASPPHCRRNCQRRGGDGSGADRASDTLRRGVPSPSHVGTAVLISALGAGQTGLLPCLAHC